jgi:hypothetical protein
VNKNLYSLADLSLNLNLLYTLESDIPETILAFELGSPNMDKLAMFSKELLYLH